LRSHLGDNEFHRGEIYDVDGNFVGEHDGIELFTIGQRKGLPGGSPRPRYVVDLDPETNRVIVGDADNLVADEFEIDRVNWHVVAGIDDPGAAITDRGYNDEFEATVKIRYNRPDTPATCDAIGRQSCSYSLASAPARGDTGTGCCHLRRRRCPRRRLDLPACFLSSRAKRSGVEGSRDTPIGIACLKKFC